MTARAPGGPVAGASSILTALRSAWRRSGLGRANRFILGLFGAALAGSAIARLTLALNAPLWLDETWTGSVSGQPTWPLLIEQIRLDANAPLYYLIMHVWTGLFGLSDLSLRIPSVLFSLATPLLIVATRVPGLRTEDRLVWASLVTVWIPGLLLADQARCYALLALLATGQTLAFARLMASPSLKRTAGWAVLTSLVILTHYQAIMLGAVQGMIYLAVFRLRAIRTWPAALWFAPAFAVLLWHLPTLAPFARPDVAWYDLVTWQDLSEVFLFLAGSWWVYPLPALGLLVRAWKGASDAERSPGSSIAASLWITGASAVVGVLLLAGIGMFRPSFTVRYATPFMPGVSLLLALGGRGLIPHLPAARSGLILMAMIFSGLWASQAAGRLSHPYTYEAASRDLLATHPRHLVFIWDHPAQQVEAPVQFAESGGFFFHRAGSRASVTPVMIRAGDRVRDPNPRLLAAARDPGSVILWIYDTHVRGTMAALYPPRIAQLDSSFGCRNYGRGNIGIVACARDWATSPLGGEGQGKQPR